METYPMRAATWDDIGAVVKLIADADQVDYGSVTYTEADVAGDWRRARFDLARDAWLALAADGTLAGYAYVWVRSSETGEILILGVVHPDHRGRGLGERLAASMEARAGEYL
ncbi:MAG: GNAT family N-acetyltransferase, partial [Actinomycetota bacterium]